LTDDAEDSIDCSMTKRAITISKIAGVCVVLIALVWAVFGQTLGHLFVNFDDASYVFRNSQVLRGVSIRGIEWAFTHPVAGNWHPLTMLSHMIDSQFFGAAPAGHHFTNVLLHSIAVLLLFGVLLQMTKAFWRSTFVAAVFAIHPLHVESVAWVAERKDVLSAVFFLLTLSAYGFYARRPSLGRYLLVAILFACGLMAKPMLVTLPFVLLLLDYWPLKRMRSAKGEARNSEAGSQGRSEKRESKLVSITQPLNVSTSFRGLVMEKIPLLVLSAAASAATIITQAREIESATHIPIETRVGNAFVSLFVYLRQTVWPRNLAVFYPYPQDGFPLWEVAVAIAGFVAITAGVFLVRTKRPYLLIGWLWFVGMLAPVIGIIQVGLQAHADRYTYLPQIGLGLIFAWGASDFPVPRRIRSPVLTAACLGAIVALGWMARVQTSTWYDSESLWRQALAVTADNPTAREHLSDAYLDNGRIEDAISQGREAVRLQPNRAYAYGVLGAALARTARIEEALDDLRTAERLNPKLALVHYNIANVLLRQGDVDGAIDNYEKELQLQPNFAEGHNNLASALFKKGEVDAAVPHLRRALELKPNYPDAHNNLGIALSQKGEMQQAVTEWNQTLQIQPDNLDAECNLAWVLATFPDPSIRDGSKALELAQRAVQLSGGKNARIWRLVAAAHGELGQFSEAIKAAQNGLALAESENNSALAETLKMNIARFESGLPLRDVNSH
jgi:protein O-mannosyl-transferase